ncbi:hypothetical protein GOBAR_DD16809 [Gossypium barbadense]|nr:hypothetical protein GOBAR_DD16809 [Gossypium barbadense]
MAPHREGSDASVEAMVAQVEKHPISSILIIIAMQTEALPVVNKFQLIENPHSSGQACRASYYLVQPMLLHGAAVAYVAELLKVPAIFVKAVTDIVDGEKPTAEEFLQNLAAVTATLEEVVTQVIDFISGKCLPEL